MSLLTLRLSTLLLAVALLQVLTLTPSFAFEIVYPSAGEHATSPCEESN